MGWALRGFEKGTSDDPTASAVTDAGPPPPAAGPDGVPEHEVQEPLKFQMRYGRPCVLVRWTGLDAAGDTWEPLDNLTNCEAAIAAFEQATSRSLPRPALPPHTGTAVAPTPIPPTGFTFEAAPPGDLGAALVGRTVLYWWPDDGWQRGTVARLCPRGAFSHAVACNRQTSALRGTADSLLDPPTAPAVSMSAVGASPAGPGGGCGPGPSTPGPRALGLSLVGGSSESQLPALGREINGHSHRMFCSLHLAAYICGSNHEQRQ